MRAIRSQYFLAFAVMGSLLPYLSVFLQRRGLTDAQIGDVFAMAGVAVFVTPMLMTLLADTRLQSRTLLAGTFAATAVALGLMLGSWTFAALLITHGLVSLAFVPVTSLQDGLNFEEQQQRIAAGRGPVPYHRTRFWGTLGFIVPSLLLYALLALGVPIGVTLVVAIGCCALGVANALTLPRVTRPPAPDHARVTTQESSRGRFRGRGRGLPTLAAVRVFLRPRVAAYCLGMWLLHLVISGYYTFYPRYLTDPGVIGLDDRWIGLIATIGVVIELPCMLAFGWLVGRIGLRGLAAAGAVLVAVRMALLGLWPTPAAAIGSQVFHGVMVLVVHVIPPVYLDRQATGGYRSSIQGMYAMLVFGTGRIAGNMLAGRIAEWSMTGLFTLLAGLCLLAAPLLAWALWEVERDEGV